MARTKKALVTLDDFRIFDARAARGREVARAIDKKTPIPYSVAIHTHPFETFMAVLTPKRFELLRLARSGKRSISELAAAARRDPSAVSKDIAKLAELGLVGVVIENNAGHGVKKIVRPVAENIEISAAIL
ncbi:regulatory protein, arsR family [Duganella sp. CF402]|uniref:HVO_A0114 family putative DNA-binding protein n=1 Tax=unclassified Duganella TaxID=2636909 RepID=UPI0008B14B90|nr:MULTISPECIES: ArsR family transcriptional regulator [unclassified Duganella]RZT08181.1 ArsR family transcriptional regulator [Duganella sp. BK701]SEM02960.1 regulatory protein, arsR family [Duganella sp. CF402]